MSARDQIYCATCREAVIKVSPCTRRNFFRVYPAVYLLGSARPGKSCKRLHAHGRRFDSQASAEQFQRRADYTEYRVVLSDVPRNRIQPRPSTWFHDEFIPITFKRRENQDAREKSFITEYEYDIK